MSVLFYDIVADKYDNLIGFVTKLDDNELKNRNDIEKI